MATTANVSFGYDAAGHRTSMSDGLGFVTYNYNNLAQLTTETRNFTGVGSYTLTYGYNLAGELASITNPWNAQVSYTYDKAGRISAVNGAGYAGVSSYASALTYRAFGSLNGMNYANGRSLSTAYDNRLRPTTWNVASVLGYNYNYDYFNEHTGRVTYAQNIQDPTLDRSYEYDHVGRLAISHSGNEARAHAWTGQWSPIDGPYSQGYDYDVWGNVTHKYGWGGEVVGGDWQHSQDIYYSYTGNRRNGFSYDAAGNLTNDIGQNFTYDVTGQQTASTYTNLQNSYDGDGLRVKRTEDGLPQTYYLRSSVLGGQVVAEITWTGFTWQWNRGYVYLGSRLLAVQQGGVYWMHEDPVTKSKRVTNSSGAIVSKIELDPWGAVVDVGNFSNNVAFQPKKFTSYERDGNGSDEAMYRRYNRWHSRFDQPDPYSGSYDLTNPQSFNRYAYVQGDPVNFVDPSGLMSSECQIFTLEGQTQWVCDPYRMAIDNPPFNGYDPKPGGVGDVPQDPVTGLNADACGAMAEQAQKIADLAIKHAGDDAAKALAEFDLNFGTLYAGTPLRNGADASELLNTGGGTLNSFGLRGQSGFKSDFQEGIAGNDQTHHFVTYFSGALNGRTGYLGIHRNFVERTRADILLGDKAVELGTAVRKDPGTYLKGIGTHILTTVCDYTDRYGKWNG